MRPSPMNLNDDDNDPSRGTTPQRFDDVEEAAPTTNNAFPIASAKMITHPEGTTEDRQEHTQENRHPYLHLKVGYNPLTNHWS